MLTPYKITDYINEYKPEWTCTMPEGCPPEDVLVADENPFFRLAKHVDAYSADDFKSYAESDPQRNWGPQLPLAVGLSLIESEAKAPATLNCQCFVVIKELYPSRLIVPTA